MYQRIGGFTAKRRPLPDGDAGTRMTLGAMQAMAVQGSKDPDVRAAAIAALDRAGAPSHSPEGQMGALFRYVRALRFVRDPVGVQGVFSPRYTLQSGGGNCAQRAILLVALTRSIGIPADLRFRAIAANPQSPRGFSHVYVVARIRGKDVPLDPTYSSNRPGYEYPGRTRVGDYYL